MELSEEEKIDELTLILNSGDNETIIDNLLEYIHKKEAKIEELKLYIEELKLDLEEMTKSNNHKQENWVHKNILNSYISKVKIREKIKKAKEIKWHTPKLVIEYFEELLEENNEESNTL